jgi:Zn-dependent protease
MSVGSIRIGSPLGIPVRLHYTWWVIFLPVLFTLAQTFYPRMYPLETPSTLWTMAAVATVLFFVSLLLHEFGHAIAARRFGIPVHSVELFALGGAAKMIGFTRRPRDEFIMASAGPAVSLAFAALTAGAYAALRYAFDVEPPLPDVLWHVAVLNLATVAFNLLPAYPLDGGRVLQGILWHMMGSRSRAALWPAAIGALVAGGLVGYGLWDVHLALGSLDSSELRRYLTSGLWWPIAIGAFIAWASLRSYRGVCLTERISAMCVAEALDDRVQPVKATLDLAAVRQLVFVADRPAVAPVLGADGRAEALLVEESIGEAPDEATVAQVAERIPAGSRVVAAADLFNAALTMARGGDPWLVVEDAEGRYVGMLTGDSLRAAMRPGGSAATGN